MKFACEIVVRDILPVLRAMLAKELIEKYGYTKSQTALTLGVTSSSVTYYLDSKRGYRTKIVEKGNLDKLVEKMAKGLAEGTLTQFDAFKMFHNACLGLRSRGLICQLHEKAFPAIKGWNCKICTTPYKKERRRPIKNR